MNDQENFCEDMLNHGEAATLVTYTGTACPCMTSRGTYSPDWHANNPAAEACNGTGIITTTPTSTAIKAFFMPAWQAIPRLSDLPVLAEIGELAKDTDLIMVGAVNSTTGAFVDLTGKDEYYDYVTYSSVNYLIRRAYDMNTDVTMGQIVLLKRKE